MNSKITLWVSICTVLVVLTYITLSSKEEFKIEEKENEIFEKKSEIKNSIPLEEIFSGGPGKDGIPSLDDPRFVKWKEADFLNEESEGILLIDGNSKSFFYPFSVLVWHELVNDRKDIGEKKDVPILVSYCPLCRTAVVFERIVDGVEVEFGVSGKLWQSNLLMYDRQEKEEDESLWSQVAGEAVVGKKTGKKLVYIPSEIRTFGNAKIDFPNLEVLSKDTGSLRDYESDPYEGYYDNDVLFFPTNFKILGLHPKEKIISFRNDDLNFFIIKKNINKKEENFVLENKQKVSIERNGEKIKVYVDGKKIVFVESFAFSWLSVYPESQELK